jgi:UMF1 family MFS transporter
MSGEAFGLYSLSGKVASIIGPLLWGVVLLVAEPLGVIRYRLGVGSLAVLMLAGFIILLRLPTKNAKKATE